MDNNHINYIEFKANNIQRVKQFYTSVFHWKFIDYGDAYVAFENSGLQGGFTLSEEKIVNGALIVLYHTNLEKIKDEVINNGGKVTQEIFEFPGGKRFHFLDTEGNELAIWSDQ